MDACLLKVLFLYGTVQARLGSNGEHGLAGGLKGQTILVELRVNVALPWGRVELVSVGLVEVVEDVEVEVGEVLVEEAEVEEEVAVGEVVEGR